MNSDGAQDELDAGDECVICISEPRVCCPPTMNDTEEGTEGEQRVPENGVRGSVLGGIEEAEGTRGDTRARREAEERRAREGAGATEWGVATKRKGRGGGATM